MLNNEGEAFRRCWWSGSGLPFSSRIDWSVAEVSAVASSPMKMLSSVFNVNSTWDNDGLVILFDDSPPLLNLSIILDKEPAFLIPDLTENVSFSEIVDEFGLWLAMAVFLLAPTPEEPKREKVAGVQFRRKDRLSGVEEAASISSSDVSDNWDAVRIRGEPVYEQFMSMSWKCFPSSFCRAVVKKSWVHLLYFCAWIRHNRVSKISECKIGNI